VNTVVNAQILEQLMNCRILKEGCVIKLVSVTEGTDHEMRYDSMVIMNRKGLERKLM